MRIIIKWGMIIWNNRRRYYIGEWTNETWYLKFILLTRFTSTNSLNHFIYVFFFSFKRQKVKATVDNDRSTMTWQFSPLFISPKWGNGLSVRLMAEKEIYFNLEVSNFKNFWSWKHLRWIYLKFIHNYQYIALIFSADKIINRWNEQLISIISIQVINVTETKGGKSNWSNLN